MSEVSWRALVLQADKGIYHDRVEVYRFTGKAGRARVFTETSDAIYPDVGLYPSNILVPDDDLFPEDE